MTTKERVLEMVEKEMGGNPKMKPIYEIVGFESLSKNESAVQHFGFLYDLDLAIDVVEGNWGDIHETCFDSAMIICRFPGTYRFVEKDPRMYFAWDEDLECYFQKEEPEIPPRVRCQIFW